MLKQGVIAWLLFHVFNSAMLLYAIHKPDPGGAKMWAYLMIALTPIAIAGLYLEARAEWHGKEDTEIGASVAALAIVAVLGALAWYLG